MRYEICGTGKYELRVLIVTRSEYNIFAKMLRQYYTKGWGRRLMPGKISIENPKFGSNHFEIRLEGDPLDERGERICLSCLHIWKPAEMPTKTPWKTIAEYEAWKEDKRNWTAWHMCPMCYSQSTFANDSKLTPMILRPIKKKLMRMRKK